MGGNAHKRFEIDRINIEERKEIIQILTQSLSHKFRFIKSPRPTIDKESHGDVDLVVVSSLNGDVSQKIVEDSGLYDQQMDSYIYDYRDKKVQVDLIRADDDNSAELFMFMLSYGDVGLIVGMVAKLLGFRLGAHRGLEAVRTLPISKNIVIYPITSNVIEICGFFHLDYKRWVEGFDTELSLFKWLEEPFKFKMKHIRADKKMERPMYSRFVRYIENKPQKDELFCPNYDKDSIEKAFKLDTQKEAFHTEYKKAFNGKIVSTILQKNHKYSLTGEDLGIFMQAVKCLLDPQIVPSEKQIKEAIYIAFNDLGLLTQAIKSLLNPRIVSSEKQIKEAISTAINNYKWSHTTYNVKNI